jgi:hypothetical protein
MEDDRYRLFYRQYYHTSGVSLSFSRKEELWTQNYASYQQCANTQKKVVIERIMLEKLGKFSHLLYSPDISLCDFV